jgi:hypothetical protein
MSSSASRRSSTIAWFAVWNSWKRGSQPPSASAFLDGATCEELAQRRGVSLGTMKSLDQARTVETQGLS